MNTFKISSILMFLLVSGFLFAQQTTDSSGLESLRFLTGTWTGEGKGEPGEGEGEFSFSYDLQNKILVRKSFAVYPPSNDKPAYRHDDIMVIYKEPEESMRSIYFDNEGHVINYSLNFSEDFSSLIFLSDYTTLSPRFRLTYTKVSSESLNIKFEIAPPGKPDEFSVYLEAAAKKK
jgi:hypothetical protein